jgi:dethiobiotin synthetase
VSARAPNAPGSAETRAAVRGWFIAGTDTGVGKTRVSVALLQALEQRGISAIGMKPVASGLDADGNNEDVQLLRAGSRARGAGQLDPADCNPYAFAPPISPHLAARSARAAIDPQHIAAAAARLAQHCELLIVEGTGGWLAPISASLGMADVAQRLALPVVLVVGLRLGCLNHALLTARAIDADGLRLAGWIGSVIEPHMRALEENLATLRERLPAPQLGVLAHAVDRSRDAAQLAAAAAAAAGVLATSAVAAGGRQRPPASR